MKKRALCLAISSLLGIGAGVVGSRSNRTHELTAPPDGIILIAPADSAAKQVPRPVLSEVRQARPGQRPQLLGMFLAEATAEETATLAADVFALPDWAIVPLLQAEVEMLMERWVVVDPDAAMAAAVQADRSGDLLYSETKSARASLLKAWGRTDPEEAMAAGRKMGQDALICVLQGLMYADPLLDYQYASQLPDIGGARVPDLLTSILEVMAERNPQQALALLLEQKPVATGGMSEVVNGWMRRDPDAALAWARLQPPGSAASAAWTGVLTHYQDADPAKARALLWQLPAGKTRSSFARELAADFARTDPGGARDWAAKSAPGRERLEMLVAVASTASSVNTAMAWQIMEELKGGGDPRGSSREAVIGGNRGSFTNDPESLPAALRQVFSQLAESDPARAFQLSLNWKDSGGSDKSPFGSETSPLDAVLTKWLQTGPEAALTALRQLPAETRIGGHALGKWMAEQPPGQVARMVQQLPAAMLTTAVGQYLTEAGKRPFAQLLEPVLLLGTADQSAIISNVSGRLSLEEVDQWKGHIDKLAPDAQLNFYKQVFYNRRGHLKPFALEAASALASTPTAAKGIGSMVSDNVPDDPGKISEWARTLPPSPGRDAAAVEISSWLWSRGNDPEASFLWAASIQAPALQEKSVREAYQKWKQLDPAAAGAALQASPLPAEFKTALSQ